jgi:hypothetical protein
MTVQAWIIMTHQQRDDATALDDEEAMLGARQIDNPLADNLGLGALAGRWVTPARLLVDPEYERWVPTLGLLPTAVMDSDIIFLPPLETK